MRLENFVQGRTVSLDLFSTQAFQRVRVLEPGVSAVQIVMRLPVQLIAAGFVVRNSNTDIIGRVQTCLVTQLVDYRFERAPGIKHIINDQQRILVGHMLDQVVEAVNPDLFALLINAMIGGCANRDVVGMNAVIVEELLDSDTHRHATSPDRYRLRADFVH